MSEERLRVVFGARDATASRPVRVELRRRGVDVDRAESGAALARLVLDRHPSLVVIEEDLDGVPKEIHAATVRRTLPQAGLILVLADETQETDRTCARLKCEALVRPVEPQQLLEAVERALPAVRDVRHRVAPLVVCVDDDAFYLRALERLLGRRGFRVATFDRPDGALESVGDLRPDMAIVDVLMPGLNGLDLAEELREICGPDLPIVMLSARDSDRAIAEGYRRGASYYITKPCEPREVLDIVDYLVGDIDPTERAAIEARL